MTYAHCRKSFFEKFKILKMNITRAIEKSKWKKAKKSCEEQGETCR
jgi:hypothetical protein